MEMVRHDNVTTNRNVESVASMHAVLLEGMLRDL
jgi:hypothetical protein